MVPCSAEDVSQAIRLAIVESVAEYLYVALWGYSQPSSLDEHVLSVDNIVTLAIIIIKRNTF